VSITSYMTNSTKSYSPYCTIIMIVNGDHCVVVWVCDCKGCLPYMEPLLWRCCSQSPHEQRVVIDLESLECISGATYAL